MDLIFQVRKLVKVKEYNLKNALQYKLDPRRVNSNQLTFHSCVHTVDRDDVLLIILVVTKDVYGDVTPTRDNEYYIEYYVQFEWQILTYLTVIICLYIEYWMFELILYETLVV